MAYEIEEMMKNVEATLRLIVKAYFSRAKELLLVCGDMDFFYNFDDQDNKFVEIIDYINENDQCDIIQCSGGKLF